MIDRSIHRKVLRDILDDGLILLSGGVETIRNNDVHYPFRQSSDFLYLTGMPQPACHVLLDPRRGTETLFVPQADADHQVWLGPLPGPAEIRRRYGIHAANTPQMEASLRRAAKGYKKVYADPKAWARFKKILKGKVNFPARLSEALGVMRATKTPGEISLLRRAGQVSGAAHRAVMAATRPGLREYELQAVFESECLRRGLKHQGYPPIVAAGTNGAILHYSANNAMIRSGDMVLIDAAAECEGYSADITRTFPASGRFSPKQREIYEIVLEAQKRCIDRARAGVVWGDLHVLAMRVMAEGLISVGILRGSPDDLVRGGAVRLFFPHGLGHMLGLDVHDSLGGKARQIPAPPFIRLRFNARLEPGFVVTVEPGLYFNPALLDDPGNRRKFRSQVDFKKADAYRGLGGIRIEDDIVIRASGPSLNLTDVPKEVKDVEAAIRRRDG